MQDERPFHALRFAGGVDKYPRTYNKPTSAEVSCVVVGNGPLPEHFVSVYERRSDSKTAKTWPHDRWLVDSAGAGER